MYNIGGDGASHSATWCGLISKDSHKWKFLDVDSYNFSGYWFRGTLVVGNKIVYFGSWNAEATFLLEREGESERLKVAREEEGFDLKRGYHNTASCVVKEKIYAFKTETYEEM